MTDSRGAKAAYVCKSCGDPFTARTADRARGWARFCSKSCKAIKQTQQGAGKRLMVVLTDEDRFGELVDPDSYAAYAETVHPFSSEAFEP